MWQVATFWLCLCLPGYALLTRWLPDAFEGGWPSGIAQSYLASFAVLSPVALLGYAFGWPLAVLSGAIVGAVAMSAGWLARSLWRERPRLQPSWLAVIASVLIVGDGLLGLRSGGFLTGDAQYHMARVRLVLDHGLKSWDPMIPGRRLDAVYHTNLYHALVASAAQLSRQHAPEAWVFTLLFAKLFCVSATYHLAWVVLRQRWLAWTATVMFTVYEAPRSVLLYPNTICGYGLLVMALAFTVEAASERKRVRPLLGLAAVAALLVQFHALYYVFACILCGPPLGVLVAHAWLRRTERRHELLIALLALGLGAPWFAVRQVTELRAVAHAQTAGVAGASAPNETAPDPEQAIAKRIEDKVERADVGFVSVGTSQLMLDPHSLIDPKDTDLRLVASLALGAFTTRRRQFALMSCALGAAAALLFIPPLCTLMVHAAGAQWIVRRLSVAFASTHHALVPGAVLLWLAERIPKAAPAWVSAALRPAGVVAAVALGYFFGVNGSHWTRAQYLAEARSQARLSKNLAMHAARRELFSSTIASEATVAVLPNRVYDLVVDCDCYPLALPPKRGTHGVAGMGARRNDAWRLLQVQTPFSARLEILRRYGVRYLYFRDTHATRGLARAYRPITAKTGRAGGDVVLVLAPDHALPRQNAPRHFVPFTVPESTEDLHP